MTTTSTIDALNPVAETQFSDTAALVVQGDDGITAKVLVGEIGRVGLSVKLYGAKGDGVTDDTAAIQDSINAPSGPATIFFPTGNYNISAPILIRHDVPLAIVGAGMYSSRLFATGALNAMLDTTDGQVYTTHIEGLGLLGGGHANYGFRCEQIIQSEIERVLVEGTLTAGVRMNEGYSNLVRSCFATANTGHGFDWSGLDNNNITLIGNRSTANGGTGFKIQNGFSVGLFGNDAEGNVIGFDLSDLHGLTTMANYTELNTGTNFQMSGTACTDVSLTGWWFGGQTAGMVFDNCDGLVVESNHLFDCAATFGTLATHVRLGHNTVTGTASLGVPAGASFNVATRTTPTQLADGDVWQDGTHCYMRINGATKQLDN